MTGAGKGRSDAITGYPGAWQRAIAAVAAMALRALGATWRVSVGGRNPLVDPERRAAAQIGAIWHRDILMAAWFFRDSGHCIGVSPSRDGDWISALLRSLGYAPPVRGSSSRGGATALRALVRVVGRGITTAVLADGPRGPAQRVKPGVVALARHTGRPITPVTFACRPAIQFGSWDGTRLPLPFARIRVSFAEPISVPTDLRRADRETFRVRVESELESAVEGQDEMRPAKPPAGG